MRHVSFLLALLLCMTSPFLTFANDPNDALGVINGKVIDEISNEPVAYAAVVIKSEDGSQTITGGITTEDGSFEINKLPDGTFIFEVQYIGYKTYSQKLVIAKGKRMALRHGFSAAGSKLIALAGVPFGTPGSTNLMHVVTVSGDELDKHPD